MTHTVRIYKEKETELVVLYRFGLSGHSQFGQLSLRKVDGWVEEVIPVMHPHGRAAFAGALHQVLDHWGRGEYPDLTYWQGGSEGFDQNMTN